jgi:acyl dehydratase
MATRTIESLDELAELTGTEVGVSDWIEISQDKIDRFADLTGDRQWIHVDAARAAAESPYHTTIAHGFLTLSLLSGMVHQAVRVDAGSKLTINYGFNRIRFPAPVQSGARVRAHVAVNGVKPAEDSFEIAWSVTVEIEGQPKPALAAEWLTRIYPIDSK